MENQLAIFKDTIHHQFIEKPLFYASFSPDLEKRVRSYFNVDDAIDLRDHFGMYNPVNISMRPPESNDACWDFNQYYPSIKKPEGSYIDHLGVLHIPGSTYHFTHHISPLRNAATFEEIKAYPFYNYSRYSSAGMKESVEAVHSQGKVASCWVGHMYEDAWQIRGYEAFLEDMILRPKWCEYILDKIKEKNIIVARAAAGAGVDVLITGDDVATQISMIFAPEAWRRIMKPRWAEVYREALKLKSDLQIWYHSDGNIEEIIPDLIDIGVTILNPIQPECMDPVKIKELYGDQLVLDGTIGTQSIMPFGTPQDVKNYIQDRREKLGYNGGLILSPTHVLEPEVPIENIAAFLEACM